MLHQCQRAPYQREGTCLVRSCTAKGEQYLVELEDSLLYPEGGGQPADHGSIAGAQVTDVQKAGDGLVVATCDAPVAPGDVEVIVDWARRYDHMQQHSAQHLITAIANERLGYPTLGFHLGDTYAAIELDTPSINDEELAQLLTWVNDAIREARPIKWREIAPEQFEAEGIRSRKLPDGHTGLLRIVDIEGIDRNTCGGTHVASTAELQLITFVGTERVRKRVRLSFLAGNRTLNRFNAQFAREQQLTQVFNKAPEEHVELLAKQKESLQDALYQTRALENELALFLGQALAANAAPGALCTMRRPGASRQMLEAIATTALDVAPEALLLLGATSDPESEEGDGIFLLKGSDPAQVKTLGTKIAAALDGRGGGKPGTYQGKVSKMEDWADAVAGIGG